MTTISLLDAFKRLPVWGRSSWALMVVGATSLFLGFMVLQPMMEWVGLGLFVVGFIVTLLSGWLLPTPLPNGMATLVTSTLLSPILSGIFFLFLIGISALVVFLSGRLETWGNLAHFFGALFPASIAFMISGFMRRLDLGKKELA
ncbi:MAG: hypothetical protein AAF514_00040 [Verrucomicrobiota bacterium]